MIIEIKGDITESDCEVIAHGVNCQNVMGSGVAKALFDKWPKVKENYHNQIDVDYMLGILDEPFQLLGTMQVVSVEKDKYVLNCFTQLHYGASGDLFLSYDALIQSLERAYRFCRALEVNEIALPKIGCGLAGGDWNIVTAILNSVFPNDFKVKVYNKG
jgi:O-acetyl-ADP-ribose deacetylase (regulator of RNase III)